MQATLLVETSPSCGLACSLTTNEHKVVTDTLLPKPWPTTCQRQLSIMRLHGLKQFRRDEIFLFNTAESKNPSHVFDADLMRARQNDAWRRLSSCDARMDAFRMCCFGLTDDIQCA
jgi:hypothetical protein